MRITLFQGLSVASGIATALVFISALSGILGPIGEFSIPVLVLWVIVTGIAILREGRKSLWLPLLIAPILLAAAPIVLIYVACGLYGRCP